MKFCFFKTCPVVATVSCIVLASGLARAAEKYEPEKGCYIGAVLDWAELAGSAGEGQASVGFAQGMKAFNKQSGKKHALFEQFFFFPHGADWEDPKYKGKYCTWDSDPCGWATPKDFVNACEAVDATPVLTIEPFVFEPFYQEFSSGNEAYERTVELAKQVGKWKKPIFIRFAHEMNGSWYPWATWSDKNRNLKLDPGEETEVTGQRYRTAFRNVALVFRTWAPNAALIWCPNQGWLGLHGTDPYTPFYPGDDVVDWVGLDFYERGFYLPHPDKKLFGGLFSTGLHDDDGGIDFYHTYYTEKRKPIMVCETGAHQTYRTDLSEEKRRQFSHRWKSGYWNSAEYGWIYQVYGISSYDDKVLNYPIDKILPGIKAIIWFQQAKVESTPSARKVRVPGTVSKIEEEVVWFDDAWCDFRMGHNSVGPSDKATAVFPDELALYRSLVSERYFLQSVVVPVMQK